jgi:hypothetical protein
MLNDFGLERFRRDLNALLHELGFPSSQSFQCHRIKMEEGRRNQRIKGIFSWELHSFGAA